MGSNVSFYNLFVVFVSFVLFVVRKLKLTPMRAGGIQAFFWIPAKARGNDVRHFGRFILWSGYSALFSR